MECLDNSAMQIQVPNSRICAVQMQVKRMKYVCAVFLYCSELRTCKNKSLDYCRYARDSEYLKVGVYFGKVTRARLRHDIQQAMLRGAAK